MYMNITHTHMYYDLLQQIVAGTINIDIRLVKATVNEDLFRQQYVIITYDFFWYKCLSTFWL